MNLDASGVVALRSAVGFDETVRRLQSTFATHSIKVFATIDQQAEAKSVGLSMPPTTLILFGNPKAGTPLMLVNPQCGVDLPLKVLISEATPGQVQVFFNTSEFVIERHHLPEALSANLAPAAALIEKALQ